MKFVVRVTQLFLQKIYRLLVPLVKLTQCKIYYYSIENMILFGERMVTTLKQQFLDDILFFLCIQIGCGYCIALLKGIRLEFEEKIEKIASKMFFFFLCFK